VSDGDFIVPHFFANSQSLRFYEIRDEYRPPHSNSVSGSFISLSIPLK
jgi:hypothetical protein